MKRIYIKSLLITILLNSSCMTVKQSKPCKQCPHYTKFNAIFLEKVKLRYVWLPQNLMLYLGIIK